MKTVIYLDELLLTNFAIGTAMLLGAGLMACRQCSVRRLLAGALLASLSSLALILPEFPLLLAACYKLSTCGAAIWLTYGFSGWRSFGQLCAWYFLLNFLLCGAVLLPGVQLHNGSIYLPLSPGRLLLCCCAVYLGLRFLLYCFGRASVPCRDAVLEFGDGKQIPVRAFYDTGFSVQEPLRQRALVLLAYPAVRHGLSPALQNFLDQYFSVGNAVPPAELSIRLVPCRTIAGHCLLPAVPVKALHLHSRHTAPLLAAFCSVSPDEPWSLLFGADVAQMLHL